MNYDYGYDDENRPTTIYSSNPAMCDVRGGGNPERLNDATMREIERINRTTLIPGQVVTPPRGQGMRGGQRGGNPRRLAAPRQYAQELAPDYQQGPQQQVRDMQYRQQMQMQQRQLQEQQQRAWEEEQEQMRQAQQQQLYLQQQQNYVDSVQSRQAPPADKDLALAEGVHREFPLFGEAYFEMIVSNGRCHVYIDLPGVKKDDFQIFFNQGCLSIAGVRKLFANTLAPKAKGKGNKGRKPYYEAMVTIPEYVQKFSYSINIAYAVDTKMMPESSLADGVLHVAIPLLSETAPNSGIAIQVQ